MLSGESDSDSDSDLNDNGDSNMYGRCKNGGGRHGDEELGTTIQEINFANHLFTFCNRLIPLGTVDYNLGPGRVVGPKALDSNH